MRTVSKSDFGNVRNRLANEVIWTRFVSPRRRSTNLLRLMKLTNSIPVSFASRYKAVDAPISSRRAETMRYRIATCIVLFCGSSGCDQAGVTSRRPVATTAADVEPAEPGVTRGGATNGDTEVVRADSDLNQVPEAAKSGVIALKDDCEIVERRPHVFDRTDKTPHSMVGTLNGDFVRVITGRRFGKYNKAHMVALSLRSKLENMPIMAGTDEIAKLLVDFAGREVEVKGELASCKIQGHGQSHGQQGYGGPVPDCWIHFFTVAECKLTETVP